MPSKITMSALLLTLALQASAHAAAEPTKVSFAWDLAIDATGHVTALNAVSLRNRDDLPQISAQMEDAIRGWQFDAGHATSATTRLHVDASLIPEGDDGLSVRIDHAYTGGTIVQPMKPPRYPPEAVSKRHEGKVVLKLRYDAAGNLADAGIDAASTNIDQNLVNASIEAARLWTFKPETLDGKPVAGSVFLPFCFNLRIRDPNHPAPPPSRQTCKFTTTSKYGASGEEHVFAENPAVKLVTNVAGTML